MRRVHLLASVVPLRADGRHFVGVSRRVRLCKPGPHRGVRGGLYLLLFFCYVVTFEVITVIEIVLAGLFFFQLPLSSLPSRVSTKSVYVWPLMAMLWGIDPMVSQGVRFRCKCEDEVFLT